MLLHHYPEPQIRECYKKMSLLQINEVFHLFNFLQCFFQV